MTASPSRSSEAPWRRRFRAARMTLPAWARDEPSRATYASNSGGKFELYAWDVATGASRQVTDRPAGTLRGGLDPTGGRAWWFDDERGSEFGRWMVEPFSGGPRDVAAPDLAPAYDAGLALGRGFAVVGSSADDGAKVHVVRRGEPSRLLYAHREHAEVAGLSRDETLAAIEHSEHGDSRHPAVRAVRLDGEAIRDLWDGPGLGLSVVAWSPVRGDQRLLILHERRDLPRPLLWNPVTGEARDLAVDLPGEVRASWYPDASAILVIHDHRGRSELYRYDLAGDALARLDTETGTIAAARVRPDGEVWYLWTRSSHPSQVRADGRVLLRPPGDPAPPGVAYTDGTAAEVHYFVAEPSGPRPHPAIFLVHGGPASHDQDAFRPDVQAWVDHGYAVVLTNYRGSTGYGKAWRDGLEGNPGFTELADIGAVRDRLVATGFADPSRTILAGRSWGGYLTLLGLGTQPERWSLGLAAVPVADYVAAFEDEMEPLKAYDRALFGGSPDEISGFYAERSPITYVERVRVPALILAGENDPRCPIRQIERYVERLRSLGKPHEVYRYDAGHASLVIDESIRQAETQIAFAAAHLGTPRPL